MSDDVIGIFLVSSLVASYPHELEYCYSRSVELQIGKVHVTSFATALFLFHDYNPLTITRTRLSQSVLSHVRHNNSLSIRFHQLMRPVLRHLSSPPFYPR